MERSQLAITLAKEAGQILLKWFQQKNDITAKGETDVVLTADLEAEKHILHTIQQHFPDDAILSEEEGEIHKDAPYRWIVDPLDGTVNFCARLPYFCTSIGIEENGRMIFAVMFDPIHQQLYTAERGKGAFVDGQQVHVSANTNLKSSVISAMSRFKGAEAQERGANDFRAILKHCRTIRIQGCSMLELCKVGQGCYDGFLKNYGAYEDYATGALFVEEAGGTVTDDQGKPWGPETLSILASNGILHAELRSIL